MKFRHIFCRYRYLKCDLENFELMDLGMKFDVILIEPPLKHYNIANGAVYDKYWSWDDVSLTWGQKADFRDL